MASRKNDERKLDTAPVEVELDKPLRHQRVDLQPGARITVPEHRAQWLEAPERAAAHRVSGAKKSGGSS